MKRSKGQKREKMGYALFIMRAVDCWERMGYLFHTKYEALTYAAKHYPDSIKFRVEAVRLNIKPTGLKSETYAS